MSMGERIEVYLAGSGRIEGRTFESGFVFDPRPIFEAVYGLDRLEPVDFTNFARVLRSNGLFVEADRSVSEDDEGVVFDWQLLADVAGPTAAGTAYVNFAANDKSDESLPFLQSQRMRIKIPRACEIGDAVYETYCSVIARFGISNAPSRYVFHDSSDSPRVTSGPGLGWYAWLCAVTAEQAERLDLDVVRSLALSVRTVESPEGDVVVLRGFAEPAAPPAESWWEAWRAALLPVLNPTQISPMFAMGRTRPVGVCAVDWPADPGESE